MSPIITKPRALVARKVFPEVLERLAEAVELETNQDDGVFSPAELADRLKDKDGALLTLSEAVNKEVLAGAPRLKIVANIAVGYNNLDLAALTAAGVMATDTPDVLTETTADFGWALLMAAARRVTESEHFLRAGKWNKWSLVDGFLGQDIYGATLGILGMGRIGQALARRAKGFGMRVIYHNRSRLAEDVEAECGAAYVGKEELLRSADHLVLVLPYSAATHHAIGAAELAHMKPSAVLVNLARGGIVDENALAAALREGRLFAAGIDVFEGEPKVNPALTALSNVVLTPHIASASDATRRGMANLAADNLLAGLRLGRQAGRPPSLLNPEVLGKQ
ncbi:MAG: D-glycerate dehydrogenase [Candidatus Protistobacter heckmanni]|nr:D-glycerate dehydrogenase [Candidatus Protistobacter heckmanni]